MKSSSKQKTQLQKSFSNNKIKKCIQQEWNAIEMIDDFIEDSFFKHKKIYSANEHFPVDENGIPRNFTQFVA